MENDSDTVEKSEEVKIDKWGILPYVMTVVKTTGHSFNEVLEFPIVTTLYLTCYQQDIQQFEEQQIERWKRTH